jgi:hypothetical protein
MELPDMSRLEPLSGRVLGEDQLAEGSGSDDWQDLHGGAASLQVHVWSCRAEA